MQKAIRAIDEILREKPDKRRSLLVQEIAMRFDLSPKECDFLERHFSKE